MCPKGKDMGLFCLQGSDTGENISLKTGVEFALSRTIGNNIKIDENKL